MDPGTAARVEAACELDLPLASRLASAGYVFVPARETLAHFGGMESMPDWEAFAASWSDLPVDTHMADHGRYRRRRHAVFAAGIDGGISRMPHQPHYQAVQYNALNGGVQRWFEPVDVRHGTGPAMQAILRACRTLFEAVDAGAGAVPVAMAWHIEVHQFRIEAGIGSPGLPTPEGMHRDGVDYVLVLLVRRSNIVSGTTLIGNDDQGFFSSFTLTEPFDAAFVDDHRVFHGVTPVEPLDPQLPAYRDVLVVTFRRPASGAAGFP